jgi:hypothetical protein
MQEGNRIAPVLYEWHVLWEQLRWFDIYLKGDGMVPAGSSEVE